MKTNDEILKELEEIKNTFTATAHLTDYQKRMWENACFIDIKNQFEKAISLTRAECEKERELDDKYWSEEVIPRKDKEIKKIKKEVTYWKGIYKNKLKRNKNIREIQKSDDLKKFEEIVKSCIEYSEDEGAIYFPEELLQKLREAFK